jgi:hypothetical protein
MIEALASREIETRVLLYKCNNKTSWHTDDEEDKYKSQCLLLYQNLNKKPV